jgi:adenylate cyclase
MSTRRLAAILAADVVGYSRLMGADEEGTLERLKALRSELIDPNIAKYHGRIVKTTGDGLLVEFASVVDSVRCAAEVQQAMPEWNAGVAADRCIELRIGINLGDIIADNDDLYGDGVNIAARIEALADAGGVFVSGTVYEQVRDRLPLGFEDRGERQVKNITRPVRVYRVLLDELASVAPGKAPLPMPDRPSIAVLPFANLSADPEQEYFSDGIADDIITELSRSRALLVIARNSSFTYKGRNVDIKQVPRELGVRYVLEGSVRRSGGRVRVVAQLIDAETGNHIWAERYDRALEDVFVVQDEITAAVVTSIVPAVAHAELQRILRKPPESLGAWEAYQRGLWHMRKGTVSDHEIARQFLRRAVDLDAAFASAHAAMAQSIMIQNVAYGTLPLDEVAKLAAERARVAIEIDPNDADAQAIMAFALWTAGNFREAWEQTALALANNPNSPQANGVKAALLIFGGRAREGRDAALATLRLSPHDLRDAHLRGQIAISHYFEGHYLDACEAAKHAIARHPGHPAAYRWLAASLGQLGHAKEAADVLRTAIEISSQAFDLQVRVCPPWFRPDDHEHMLDGLRKAGWQG